MKVLFYLASIAASFWVADAILKSIILGAPRRMLWYCSIGLGLTAIALFRRSPFLLTTLFCLLLVSEGLWTVSFFSQLLTGVDINGVASYFFAPNYPWYQAAITLYHLILVPFLIVGIIKVGKIHPWGWLGAFIISYVLGFLAFIFPDQVENVNCVQRLTHNLCEVFFSPFYGIENKLFMIFLGVANVTIIFYIPINAALLLIARLRWFPARGSNSS